MEPNNIKKIGPIVVTLIIVLVLVIAALYIFASRLSENGTGAYIDSDTSASSLVDDTTIVDIPTITNTSDDPESLLKDLESATNGLESNNF
jgi:uncharacterized protein YxeA